jgi:hypothetical protein
MRLLILDALAAAVTVQLLRPLTMLWAALIAR